MEITATRLLIIILEIACIALSASLVVIFAKIYKIKQSIYLLCLPLGVFFLMSSYSFLLVHHLDLTFRVIDPLSSSLMWLRTVTQTIGFSLIAASYIFASRNQNTSKQSYAAIVAASAALMLTAFGALYLLNPTGLASIYSYSQLFAWANMALISLVVIVLDRKLLRKATRSPALAISMSAYFALWLSQLAFLIFSLAQGGVIALVGSQVARIASFAIFILIYYSATKEALHDRIQTEQS